MKFAFEYVDGVKTLFALNDDGTVIAQGDAAWRLYRGNRLGVQQLANRAPYERGQILKRRKFSILKRINNGLSG